MILTSRMLDDVLCVRSCWWCGLMVVLVRKVGMGGRKLWEKES